MNKILYIVAVLLVFTSCENFLDTENYTKKTADNFPTTLKDAQSMLSGIYATQILISSSAEQTSFYLSELAADDRFGGGGENDKRMQAYDKLMNTGVDLLGNLWQYRYRGIFRANMAIETLDNCKGFTSEQQKNQMKGEVYFLRGYFYHELAEVFENVPLVLSTIPENLPQAEPEQLYAQIAFDLKTAIELMSSDVFTTVESGHVTKWDAEALLARVFLFYTGFYGKDALPLCDAEGNITGSITKDQVIAWIEDCINNSGHKLVDDYRELWAYTNRWTAKDYPYAKGLTWVGNGHENLEQMFSIKFSTMASWNTGTTPGYSNQYALHFSLRNNNGQEGTFPFGQGWGAGPVNTSLWNEWKVAEPNDIRRQAAILDAEAECANYKWGQDMQVEETGFWSKKYMNIQAYDGGELYKQFGKLEWNSPNDNALGNPTDLILIRFADVLLMHSELKHDVSGINQLRARAGLDPISSYSLETLKQERRYELCFEGRRWADIRRWGDATASLDKQVGVTVRNIGVETSMKNFGDGFKLRYEQTRGFFPIPETQISLSDGVLKQNKGWGGAESIYQGW